MKFLFKLFFTLILVVVIAVGGAAAYIYYSFFNVQPVAEYVHMNSADQITSIEIAKISFEGSIPSPAGMGVITDKEAFLADLNELQCYKGIDINSVGYITESQSLEGIVIHYADGSTEYITPYISVGVLADNSGITGNLYSFKPDEFSKMLEKYKDLYVNPDILDKIPSLDGIELPDDIEIPEGIIPDGN